VRSLSGPSATTKHSDASADAVAASARRMRLWSSFTRSIGSEDAHEVVSYPGLGPAAGMTSGRPPARTAQRSTRTFATSDRRPGRSQTVAPTAKVPQSPGTGPRSGSSSVSRASMRRTPSTNAMVVAPSSAPSTGSQSPVSTVGSTEPSVGWSASEGSSGEPYSGAHPSTKIRAMGAV